MAIRRKKGKLTKLIQKKKKSLFKKIKSSKRISERKIKQEVISPKPKKEILGQQEMAIEKTKYYTAIAPKTERTMLKELPQVYNQDKFILQVRDPWWIHGYWEICSLTVERLKNELKDDFYKGRPTLRVYDISHIVFNGKNAHRFFDIQIDEKANNWYINVSSGRSWCVDFGLLLPDGRFITILRSNTVSTPIEGPSWITDEEWMIPEDMFSRLYGMGFGLGKSSPGKAWQERVRKELFSGVLASGGISSLASPVKKARAEKKFWLVVNTELIVYGATEPNAKVYIQDKQINLRGDGTFTLRFALPNGRQVIPVKAISTNNEEERTITPVVSKETR